MDERVNGVTDLTAANVKFVVITSPASPPGAVRYAVPHALSRRLLPMHALFPDISLIDVTFHDISGLHPIMPALSKLYAKSEKYKLFVISP